MIFFTVFIVVLVIILVLVLDLFNTPSNLSPSDRLQNLTQPTSLKIDALYLWVNTNDPTWIQTKNQYLNHKVPNQKNRFQAKDFAETELKTSFYALFRFAPWINRVFLVTCRPQVPAFLASFPFRSRVEIVHHDELVENETLKAKILPTFNSTTIETFAHTIPALSEHFLYFNDDMILNNYVTPQDFFQGEKPLFRINMKLPVYALKILVMADPSNIYVKGLIYTAQQLGYDVLYRNHHGVQGYRKSHLQKLQHRFSQALTYDRFRCAQTFHGHVAYLNYGWRHQWLVAVKTEDGYQNRFFEHFSAAKFKNLKHVQEFCFNSSSSPDYYRALTTLPSCWGSLPRQPKAEGHMIIFEPGQELHHPALFHKRWTITLKGSPSLQKERQFRKVMNIGQYCGWVKTFSLQPDNQKSKNKIRPAWMTKQPLSQPENQRLAYFYR